MAGLLSILVKDYEGFTGKIGRTVAESEAAWPPNKHPGEKAPAKVQRHAHARHTATHLTLETLQTRILRILLFPRRALAAEPTPSLASKQSVSWSSTLRILWEFVEPVQ